jgi:hypothetical protein
MDISRPAVTEIETRASSTGSRPKRQQRTVEEKRRIVEATLVEGASVARVARAHGVNANQVFGWPSLPHALFFFSQNEMRVPHPCVFCKGGRRCCC